MEVNGNYRKPSMSRLGASLDIKPAHRRLTEDRLSGSALFVKLRQQGVTSGPSTNKTAPMQQLVRPAFVGSPFVSGTWMTCHLLIWKPEKLRQVIWKQNGDMFISQIPSRLIIVH